MTISIKPLTSEDLWNMPDNGGHYELVRGELRPMSPGNFRHGKVANLLSFYLTQYVLKHKLGDVTAAETGFRLSANTVLAPDIGFVLKKRSAKGVDKFFPGAPDLAVEVLSPYDRFKEVEEKVDDYFSAGTRLVWVADPKKSTVTVFRKNGDSEVLEKSDSLSGEEVVPGFKCKLSEIFPDD